MARTGEPINISYRPDIDGLRAVAVLAVIVNHFNQSLLPGGFLGVDVFFVISGFVVTASLIEKQPSSAREFLIGFYSRRVRRLFPALLVTTLLVGLAAILLVPASGISLLTMITALFGASNIYLILGRTDYFALAPSRNLFAHTWSLGVEEQFYLIYPIILWLVLYNGAAIRNRRGAIRILGVLAIASFLCSLTGEYYSPARNYYLMPSRFWELAAGALVSLALAGRGAGDIARGQRSICFILLLAALIGMMYAPAAWRLPVSVCIVLLTAGLLAVSGLTPAGTTAVTPSWGAYLGRLSYSMYLWHWPLLYFAALFFSRTPRTLGGVTTACVAISVIQYTCIEQPLRRKQWKHGERVIAIGFAMATLGALTLGATYYLHQRAMTARGFDYTYEPIKTKRGLGLANRLEANHHIDYTRFDITPVTPSAGTIWVVGDSTGESMVGLFELARERLGYGTKYLTGRCIPFTRYIERDENGAVQFCAEFNRLVSEQLPSLASSGDIVFIAHIDQFRDDSPAGTFFEDAKGRRVGRTLVVEDVMRNALAVIDKLAARGVQVVYMLPTPFLKRYAGECYPEQVFRGVRIAGCRTPKEDFWHQSKLLRGAIATTAGKLPDMAMLDPSDTLCPAGECLPYSESGLNLYRDNYHLSRAGATLLMKPFLAIIGH